MALFFLGGRVSSVILKDLQKGPWSYYHSCSKIKPALWHLIYTLVKAVYGNGPIALISIDGQKRALFPYCVSCSRKREGAITYYMTYLDLFTCIFGLLHFILHFFLHVV